MRVGGNVTPNELVLLIVEDDEEMRSLLCDELWAEGYQVRQAKNGDEALTAASESAPKVIITDLRMPSGGVSYINSLRTLAPDCPIIVITAFGDKATKSEVLAAGATRYFSKPVRISELKATVKELVVTLRAPHEGRL